MNPIKSEGLPDLPKLPKPLPCPFCGGACAVTAGHAMSELPWSDDGGAFHRVYCSKCQSRQLFHRTAVDAIAAWNHRASHAAPIPSVDAVPDRAYEDFVKWGDHEAPVDAVAGESVAPIDMALLCPKCGLQHIDMPEPDLGPSIDGSGDMPLWNNPPHRSHLCHGCGHVWRPADVPTNGVQAVKTKGKADSPTLAASVASLAVVGEASDSMPTCTYKCEAYPECSCAPDYLQDAIGALNHVLDCLLRDSPDEIQSARLESANAGLYSAALTPSPAPSAAPQEADALREALAELVACKDLKDSIKDSSDFRQAHSRNEEYRRRQPSAWTIARAALAQHQPQQGEQHE